MSGAAVPLDGRSVDILGLAYPLAAHQELTGRGRPGHEKELDIAWLFAAYAPENTVPAARHRPAPGRAGEVRADMRRREPRRVEGTAGPRCSSR
ncbi:hypothetical protein ACU686_40660 [Yinghuangia aomiensis]